jgi:exopolyphosphatase/guanosine-5'-triphosphate,3'-diphosphate pyrophosphatase
MILNWMRVAALDLGSNSFHALIADVQRGGRLQVVERAKRMPRIGEGIFRTGAISDHARRSALRALDELMPVIERHDPDAVCAVATSAVREARNGRRFVADVRDCFGLDVRVISGDEEARLSYAGARAHLGDGIGRATLFDLGGGSLEAIVGDGRRILRTATAPLGVLRAVVEQPLSDPASPRELRALEEWAGQAVATFLPSLGDVELGRVILCAGTARAVRSVAQALGYAPTSGTGSDLVGRDTLRYLMDRLAALPLTARRETPGLEPARADLIVHGIAMLDALLAGIGVAQARVCRAALREGLILEQSRARRKRAPGRAQHRVHAAPSGTRLPSRTATIRAARPAYGP